MTARVLVLLGLLLPGEAVAGPRLRPASAAAPVILLALADESPLELEWNAPPECPDGATVKSSVLRLAGVNARDSRHLKARASIQPAAGTGWTLALTTELDGVAGERTLSGISCRSLGDAAVLVLALILNPEVARTTPPPTVDAAPTSARIAEATPARGSRPEDQHPPLSWSLGVHAGLQAGVLKAVGPAFALSLAAGLGRAWVRLVPRFALPQDVLADGQAGTGGRLWWGAAAMLGCWSATRGRAELSPCLGVDVVRLSGRGFGAVSEPRERSIYWTSAEVALIAGLRLGRAWTLEITGVGLFPFTRPSVYLDEIGTISRPAAFAFTALAGVEYRLR